MALWLNLQPIIRSLVEAVLALLVASGILMLGVGIGERLLAGLRTRSEAERLVLTGGLGLGALSYSFLALGLIGLLHPLSIGLVLTLAAVWAVPRSQTLRFTFHALRSAFRPTEDSAAEDSAALFKRLGITLIGAMLLIVLLRALAPVIDYDGLAYHLVVPRDYVRAGRIFPYPGEAHPNFPLTVDLLYIPPILLGLESAAKLIHLGCGVLMGLGVYTLSERLLDSMRGAWLGLFVLCTTPIIGTVGGYAHTDLGWALFEFLAAYAILCWHKERKRTWLALAGVFAGLGLGSKYLGLAVWGVLGLTILVQSAIANLSQDTWLDPRGWKPIITNGLLFGLVALAVASPWYLKNWLWLGNPFYPLWFGGRGWDAYKAANLQFVVSKYGAHRGLLGYLLLPLELFLYPWGNFGTPFSFPPPLSLLLPLYLLFRKRKAISLMIFMATIRFGTWAVSSRNARYLMDIYPLLSVAVAYILLEIMRSWNARKAVQTVVFLSLMANLTWQGLMLVKDDPLPVILGLESEEHYLLEHNASAYPAIRFINRLPASSKVFFVGSGQSYYVAQTEDSAAEYSAKCVPDVDHDNWGHLAYRQGKEPEQLRQALAAQGFTHVYYSGSDFEWRLNFDFEGTLAEELELFDRFAKRCMRMVYTDGKPNGDRIFALSEGCEE